MANVSDYMNRELVYLRDGDRAELLLRPLLAMGLTAAPILDEEHRPVGVVTLRDLLDEKAVVPQRSVVTISKDATIEAAAETLVNLDLHHLVVVDTQGMAVGMISSLDVVRGIVGAPAKHPASIGEFARRRAIGAY